MSNSMLALGRILDSSTRAALQTFPYFKLTHKYNAHELRLGTQSTLFAAARMIFGSNETARSALREMGTWHGDSVGGHGQMVVTARGKQMRLEMV